MPQLFVALQSSSLLYHHHAWPSSPSSYSHYRHYYCITIINATIIIIAIRGRRGSVERKINVETFLFRYEPTKGAGGLYIADPQAASISDQDICKHSRRQHPIGHLSQAIHAEVWRMHEIGKGNSLENDNVGQSGVGGCLRHVYFLVCSTVCWSVSGLSNGLRHIVWSTGQPRQSSLA